MSEYAFFTALQQQHDALEQLQVGLVHTAAKAIDDLIDRERTNATTTTPLPRDVIERALRSSDKAWHFYPRFLQHHDCQGYEGCDEQVMWWANPLPTMPFRRVFLCDNCFSDSVCVNAAMNLAWHNVNSQSFPVDPSAYEPEIGAWLKGEVDECPLPLLW